MINQVLSAVRDIVEAIENKFTEEDYLDVEEPGYFVSKIDQVCFISKLSLNIHKGNCKHLPTLGQIIGKEKNKLYISQ